MAFIPLVMLFPPPEPLPLIPAPLPDPPLPPPPPPLPDDPLPPALFPLAAAFRRSAALPPFAGVEPFRLFCQFS